MMRLRCRRVLAGDAADQPGRLGGELSAAGAQRAAPGQREPGREGDPQLRAGRPVDRAALARLVSSISRFLTPEQAVTATAATDRGGRR